MGLWLLVTDDLGPIADTPGERLLMRLSDVKDAGRWQ